MPACSKISRKTGTSTIGWASRSKQLVSGPVATRWTRYFSGSTYRCLLQSIGSQAYSMPGSSHIAKLSRAQARSFESLTAERLGLSQRGFHIVLPVRKISLSPGMALRLLSYRKTACGRRGRHSMQQGQQTHFTVAVRKPVEGLSKELLALHLMLLPLRQTINSSSGRAGRVCSAERGAVNSDLHGRLLW